jgi:hypothetical protein
VEKMADSINFDYVSRVLCEYLGNFINNNKIIDYRYIKKIIKNWKITNFGLDENGMVTNKFAIEALNKVIANLLKILPENLEYIVLSKTYLDIKNSFADKTFIRHFFLHDICKEIYNYENTNIAKKDDEIAVFSGLTFSMLNNYQGLLFSYLSGDYLTAIQKIRIVYETYIIFRYINEHKELAKPFFDHKEIMKYSISRYTMKEDETDENYIEIVNKYGEDFTANYGWTKDVIKNKSDRKLLYIANDLGAGDNLNMLYKITSNIIHTSSFSVFYEDKLDSVILKTFLPATIEMLIDQTIKYAEIMCKDKKESDFINIFVHGLKTQLYKK